MTAYQMLHRTARVHAGETVLVHGAAGRVGTAALELGAVAGLRLYRHLLRLGTSAAVERLGAVAIDYRNEDFLARVRELTGGDGVDVVLDGIGGKVALRSFRALRNGNPITGDPGGRLVTMGTYNTLAQGRKSMRGVVRVVAGDGDHLALGHALVPPAGLRLPDPDAAHPTPGLVRARTSKCCSSCSVRARSTRSWPSACRCPMLVARTRCSRARRRRASSCSCHKPTEDREPAPGAIEEVQ